MPELNLKVFRGDHPKEWPAWWDTFCSSIHENPRVKDKVTKFNYLVHFTAGPAAAEGGAQACMASWVMCVTQHHSGEAERGCKGACGKKRSARRPRDSSYLKRRCHLGGGRAGACASPATGPGGRRTRPQQPFRAIEHARVPVRTREKETAGLAPSRTQRGLRVCASACTLWVERGETAHRPTASSPHQPLPRRRCTANSHTRWTPPLVLRVAWR